MSSLCSVDPWRNKFQTGQRTWPHGQQVIGVWFKTSVTPKRSSHHPWKHPRLATCSCEKQSPCLLVVSCSLSLYLGPAFLKPLLYIYLYVCTHVCVHTRAGVCTTWHSCGTQSTTHRSQFSPSTMCAWGIKLRVSGWVTITLIRPGSRLSSTSSLVLGSLPSHEMGDVNDNQASF